MKRIFKMWPDIVISGFVTLVSTTPPTLPSIRSISLGGQYFTAYFSKKSTPAAVWETDVFKAINRNMSWIWSGLFAASLVTAAVPGLFLPRPVGRRPLPSRWLCPAYSCSASAYASIKNILPIINIGWVLKTIH